jgi:Helix-turn-helix domain
MAFTKISTNQLTFLEQYLRGTGRSLTARQAESMFGIKNIRARMTEFRHAGLKVNTKPTTDGRTSYSVAARDVTGSRAGRFV